MIWARDAIAAIHFGNTEVAASRYVRTVILTATAVVLFISGIVLNAPTPEIVYKAF